MEPREFGTPKKVFPKRLQRNNSDVTTTTTRYSTTTAPLDEAMKELLDMCQQYTEELSMGSGTDDKNNSKQNALLEQQQQQQQKPIRSEPIINNNKPMKQECDTNNHQKRNATNVTDGSNNKSKHIDPIERLQQRQVELQLQLDEVLQVAKELEARQRRKLNCLLEEQDDDQEVSRLTSNDVTGGDDLDDGDDELIEFQKIENELRTSELNRQLDHIQEELRLRLYKRLLSNTTRQRVEQNFSNHSEGNRRGSYPDETSPSSSSCSDEVTTSTNSNSHPLPLNTTTTTSQAQTSRDAQQVNSSSATTTTTSQHATQPSLTETTSLAPRVESLKSQQQATTPSSIGGEQLGVVTTNNNNNDNKVQQAQLESDYKILTPTTSRDSVISSKPSISSEWSSIYGNTSSIMVTSYATPSPTCPSNHRNSSANSDLERIEEDEEDCPDGYYGNSEHFRTIYEEKLSPIIYEQCKPPPANDNPSRDTKEFHTMNDRCFEEMKPPRLTIAPQNQGENLNDNVNSFTSPAKGLTTITTKTTTAMTTTASAIGNRGTSRPLTLYLPKPNEEIDLVEHIQALGHDLNMISSDLKLDAVSAQGYLWKCCSNNSKKWLKRYFHFDRNMKALSYYDSRSELVKKKNCSPKNIVPFEAINDVYVDHKLSGIGEKDRSRKRHYVFVLATEGRKYLLASSRAETMRAWIDILFTAAKANDYFQEEEDGDGDNNNNNDGTYDESVVVEC